MCFGIKILKFWYFIKFYVFIMMLYWGSVMLLLYYVWKLKIKFVDKIVIYIIICKYLIDIMIKYILVDIKCRDEIYVSL